MNTWWKRNAATLLAGVVASVGVLASFSCSEPKAASGLSAVPMTGTEMLAEWDKYTRAREAEVTANAAEMERLARVNADLVARYSEDDGRVSAALKAVEDARAKRVEWLTGMASIAAPFLGPAAPLVSQVMPYAVGLVAGGAVVDSRRKSAKLLALSPKA